MSSDLKKKKTSSGLPSESELYLAKINCVNATESTTTSSVDEDIPERGEWVGKMDFLFSCISYAVGLGNVWRFPYLCYEYGGGAFLVPYFICLVFCAIPMFMMEVAIGQYLSTGGIGVWELVPIFKGIGYASMTIVFLYNLYYVVIISWTLIYFVSSFTSLLPWKNCDPSWSSDNCVDLVLNGTTNVTDKSTSPVVEFWERRVLGITSGIHDLGSIRWELALYLFVAWVLVYLVIWKGLHNSGKIMWFTSIFPYLILTILFFRGVTLQGAGKGLSYYITPNWSRLLEAKVWVAAGTQVFFTFGIGFGSVITLGSYNKFHHNFYRDSLILCAINPLTSLFAGTVIFSVLGYMAETQGKEVADVVSSGPGLAFLAYPEVVIQLPIAPLWSILFFLMLIILGIDSQFCTVEALIQGIVDEYPKQCRPRRKLVTLIICVSLFLMGLPMVTEGGMYIFQLMDFNAASGITILFTVFFQTIGIFWVYGSTKFGDHIEEMIGKRPSLFYRISWMYIVPAITLGIFLFSIFQYKPLEYGNNYTYPLWGQMMGWGIALASMVWIPCYVIYYLCITPGTLKERFVRGVTPLIKPKRQSTSSSPDKECGLDSIQTELNSLSKTLPSTVL